MRRTSVLFAAIITLVSACSISARTWHIPDDAPTIAAGIDSAATGDTVMVECGTYYETNIPLEKSGVYLTSETGLPDCVTIDGEQSGRIMYVNFADTTTQVRGIRFTNGLAYNGGGAYVYQSAVRYVNCVFTGNTATLHGGALALDQSSARLINCRFDHNVGAVGVIRINDASPVIKSCTIADNNGGLVGSIEVVSGISEPVIKNTIIANDSTGWAVYCLAGAAPLITHCCIFGNTGGDSLCGGYYQNLFVDPLFCYTENPAQPYAVHANSPCAPSYNPWSEWIGALESGCPSPIEPVGWGNVKKMLE